MKKKGNNEQNNKNSTHNDNLHSINRKNQENN